MTEAVDDLVASLRRASEHHARVATKPEQFYIDADSSRSFAMLYVRAADCIEALRATLLRAEADRDEAVKALEPFAQFAKAFTQHPLYGTGDVIYRIHGGTQWEAGISKAACERAASVHARLSRTVDKEKQQP